MGAYMIVLCDQDQVLADLLTVWLEQYADMGGERLAPSHFAAYNWQNQVSDPVLFERIVKSGGIFSCAKPMPEAVQGFGRLCRHFDTFIVTKVLANAGRTYDHKLGWVYRYFPWFDRGRMVFTGHKALVRGDVLIEDSPENLDSWLTAWPAGIGILIDHPYNRTYIHPRVTRVANLNEACDYVLRSSK